MLLDSATYSVPAFAISQWQRPLVFRKIGPCSLLISKSPQQQYHHVWLCICTRLHVSLLTCHASRRSLPAKSTMTKRPTRVTDCAPASSSPSWQSKQPNRRRYLVKLMVGWIQASNPRWGEKSGQSLQKCSLPVTTSLINVCSSQWRTQSSSGTEHSTQSVRRVWDLDETCASCSKAMSKDSIIGHHSS